MNTFYRRLTYQDGSERSLSSLTDKEKKKENLKRQCLAVRLTCKQKLFELKFPLTGFEAKEAAFKPTWKDFFQPTTLWYDVNIDDWRLVSQIFLIKYRVLRFWFMVRFFLRNGTTKFLAP